MDLSQCPLFAEFTAAELAALKAIAHQTVLEAGAYAFHEKEPGEALLVLAVGTLQITKLSPSGDEEELAVLSSGSCTGEMAFFGHGRRSASGKALERVELIALPYGKLRALLDSQPVIAAKFYKAVATGVVRRVHSMNDNVSFLKAFLKARA